MRAISGQAGSIETYEGHGVFVPDGLTAAAIMAGAAVPLLLILVLVILCLGGLPSWGYHNWGYAPSGGFGLIVIVLVVLLLMGRI